MKTPRKKQVARFFVAIAAFALGAIVSKFWPLSFPPSGLKPGWEIEFAAPSIKWMRIDALPPPREMRKDPALSAEDTRDAEAFAVRAVSAILTYESDTGERHFSEEIAPYFTEEGLKDFNSQLRYKLNFVIAERRHHNVATHASQAHAQVTASSMKRGCAAYVVRLRCVTEFTGDADKNESEYILVLTGVAHDKSSLKIVQWFKGQ